MLFRLDLDIKEIVNEMLDCFPKEIWESSSTTFFDPCIAGGQFVSAIENRLRKYGHSDDNIKNRVFGVEVTNYRVKSSVNKYKLIGNYIVADFLNSDVFNGKKFDVVVTNPEFNYARNKNNNQSKDAYPDYFNRIKSLYISYAGIINPSRWFIKDSSGTDTLRNDIVDNFGLMKIKDISYIYPTIRGGVNYCIFKKGYTDLVDFNNIFTNIKKINNTFGSILTLNELEQSILMKCKRKSTLDKKLRNKGYFGIKTNDSRFVDAGDFKCKVSTIKGTWKYLMKQDITVSDKHKNTFNKYKVSIPSAYGEGNDYFTSKDICIVNPGEFVNDSYVFFEFDNIVSAENFKKYFDLKLVNWLIKIIKNKQHISKSIFKFVPIMNYNNTISDNDLYQHLNLTKQEIEYINNKTL